MGKDKMAFESSDEAPIKSPAVSFRTVTRPLLQRVGISVVGIKVVKMRKSLARECRERGEMQAFMDDINYFMDGLHDSQNVTTRYLSAINLVNKCASLVFRMRLRTHEILAKILSALYDAAKYPTLALCTASIVYMVSCDRLAFKLNESSLKLILQLLFSESQMAEADLWTLKTYKSIQQKIHSVFDGFNRNGKVQHKEMLITDITAGNLAMEALLKLITKHNGGWFKDELRTLGGLDCIVDTVSKAVDSFDEAMLELTNLAINSVKKVDWCFRVLHTVVCFNPENQNHLIDYNSCALIHSLVSCLMFCEARLPFAELTMKGDKPNKDCLGYVIYRCLLSTLGTLINVTYDNVVASAEVGQKEGLMKTVLNCVLHLPQYLPNAERYDVLVLGLCLLGNLIKHGQNNLQLMLNTPTVAPFNQHPPIHGTLTSLEALAMMFGLWFKEAKACEAEHDAVREERAQNFNRKLECFKRRLECLHSQADANENGMWQESDSGIQWIADPKESQTRDSINRGGDDVSCDRDVSCDGDFQLMGGTSLQGDSEDDTKALRIIDLDVEKTVVAAHVAVVVSCVIEHDWDLEEKVRNMLPDCSFDPMIRMLRKYLGFMKLSAPMRINRKSVLRAIAVLESCR